MKKLWHVLRWTRGMEKWQEIATFSNPSDTDIEMRYWTSRYPEYNICISETPAEQVSIPASPSKAFFEIANWLSKNGV